MKTLNIFAASLAVALGLFACNKTDENANNPQANQPKEVVLKLGGNAEIPTTASRSIVAPVPVNDPLTVNDGLVYFITDQGNVVSVFDLSVADAFGAAGQKFTNINGSASEVYIVANYMALNPSIESTLRAADTKSTIQGITSSIANQQTSHKTVVLTNVLDGLQPTYDGKIKLNGNTYEAHVLIAPSLARIQLTDIKTTDPDIVSFKFNGVYVDRFYPAFYMATDKGGAGTKLSVEQNPALLGGLAVNLFDKPTAPVASTANKVTAADAFGTPGSYVWAYQTTTTNGGPTDVPRLIVVLSSVVVNNGQGGTIDIGPRYVTITGFRDGSNNLISNFMPGNIYNIPADAFNFKIKDLGTTPNAPNIDVTVMAQVRNWTIADVSVVL